MTGKHIGEFVSIGGGAKSEVWAQIKADIMGVNISLDLNDMAPIGAALLAGVVWDALQMSMKRPRRWRGRSAAR